MLGFAYLGIILAMMLSGSGFAPLDPFLSAVNILVLFTAVWMVFFWVVLNHSQPKKALCQNFACIHRDFCCANQHQQVCGTHGGQAEPCCGQHGWFAVVLTLYLAFNHAGN